MRDYQLLNLIVGRVNLKRKPSYFKILVTENNGSAALGFSPCYDCPIAYQLKLTNDEAKILVNGTVVQSQTILGILR